MAGRIKRTENIERECSARDEYTLQFTGNSGQMLAGDPAEWLSGPFQEYLCAWFVLQTLGIAIRDRFDGYSITDLSPERLEFSLDHPAVFLWQFLILQPLSEAINGHESHSVFLRWRLPGVLRDHQAVFHPIATVGYIHDANPIGSVRSAPCHPHERVFHDDIEIQVAIVLTNSVGFPRQGYMAMSDSSCSGN